MKRSAVSLLEAASRLLAVVGLICLTGVSVGVVADIALRVGFNSPIDGLSEVFSLIAAITIASFLPLSMVARSHVSLRFLNRLLGPRGGWLLEQFGALVTLVFVALMSWQLLRYAREMIDVGEKTWILQLAVGPWWMVVGGLFVLSALIQFAILVTGPTDRTEPSGPPHA